jgi:hypothetical protein
MEKTRLWELYAALSRHDLRELEKFARSPAFNQRPQVVSLAGYFRRCRLEERLPEKAEAWREAFPGLAYDDARLHNTVSLLLDVAEHYLLVQRYRRQRSVADLHLAAEYRALGLTRHSDRAVRAADQAARSAPHENADFYWFSFQLEQERYALLAAQNRMAELNLQAISDHLDLFYLAQKLRQACFSIAHQTVAGKRYDHGLLADVRHILERGRFIEVPAIGVYYFCYRALTEPDDETAFLTFKKLLLEHRDRFPAAETRDLLLLATNYCIRRLNSGNRQYAREALDLYRDGLRDDVILLNGRMSRFTFGNIVTMAVAVRELDWGHAFVEQYSQYLESRHRASTVAFNTARLAYERRDYDRALVLLQDAEYSDPLLNLSAKTLLMKIYAETRQYDVLQAHLDAVQNFLRRHKELGYHRENYRRTIGYVNRILKANPLDKQRFNALAEAIRSTPAMAERQWLLAWLEEEWL